MQELMFQQVMGGFSGVLRMMATRAFDVLGWGGIAAVVAGCLLLLSGLRQAMTLLSKPWVTVACLAVLAAGLHVMWQGWSRPKIGHASHLIPPPEPPKRAASREQPKQDEALTLGSASAMETAPASMVPMNFAPVPSAASASAISLPPVAAPHPGFFLGQGAHPTTHQPAARSSHSVTRHAAPPTIKETASFHAQPPVAAPIKADKASHDATQGDGHDRIAQFNQQMGGGMAAAKGLERMISASRNARSHGDGASGLPAGNASGLGTAMTHGMGPMGMTQPGHGMTAAQARHAAQVAEIRHMNQIISNSPAFNPWTMGGPMHPMGGHAGGMGHMPMGGMHHAMQGMGHMGGGHR